MVLNPDDPPDEVPALHCERRRQAAASDVRTATTQVTETRMKSAIKTKARKTNNQASFGQSLLKNNMEVEAAMELSRNLDETGLPLVCMLGLHQVCIKFASSVFLVNPNFMLGLDFCPNFMLGLDGLHDVCRWFALER